MSMPTNYTTKFLVGIMFCLCHLLPTLLWVSISLLPCEICSKEPLYGCPLSCVDVDHVIKTHNLMNNVAFIIMVLYSRHAPSVFVSTYTHAINDILSRGDGCYVSLSSQKKSSETLEPFLALCITSLRQWIEKIMYFFWSIFQHLEVWTHFLDL